MAPAPLSGRRPSTLANPLPFSRSDGPMSDALQTRSRLSGLPERMQWAVLIAASLVGSAALDEIGFPAALLVGPMIVSVAFAISGVDIRLPRIAFLLAQGVAGCLIASCLTPETLVSLVGHWPILFAAVLGTLVFASLVGWAAGRFGNIAREAAVWGFLPGMASAVIALADDFGVDARIVAFIQYMRVAIVVLIMSFLSRFLFHSQPGDAAALNHPFVWGAFLVTLAIVAIAPAAARLRWLSSGAMLVPMVVGPSPRVPASCT